MTTWEFAIFILVFIGALFLAAFAYKRSQSITPGTLFWRKFSQTISTILFFLIVLLFVASLAMYLYCYGRCLVDAVQVIWFTAMSSWVVMAVAIFNTNTSGLFAAPFSDLPLLTFPILERWKGMCIAGAMFVIAIGMYFLGNPF